MSLVVVHRPARMPPPGVPSGEVALAAPPAIPRDGPGSVGWMQYALPVVGSLASLLFMLTNPRPLYIMGGLIFAMSAVFSGVAMAVMQSRGQRQRVAAERRRYLDYLAEVRQQARDVAHRQHAAAAWSHPPPDALWTVVAGRSRLWERRPGEAALRCRAARGGRAA